jgi:hypothetical protein
LKPDRYFYTAVSTLFLVLVAGGFHLFVPNGLGAGGRIINPAILPIVVLHGLAITAWYVLFFAQSVLIAVRNRKVHMVLGWAAVVIAPLIGITGTLVAYRSIQTTPPNLEFWGMSYLQFFLPMLAEIAVFAGFVTAGVWTRKQPRIHKSLMLCASLSLLAGATARIPFFGAMLGFNGFLAIFRPVIVLALLLLLVRYVQTRSLDRPMAIGFTVLFGVLSIASFVAKTHAWDAMAAAILRL